jgi:hypothetical protein
MAIQYAVECNNAALDAKEATIGTAPTLEGWSGTKPAHCADADTGTKIASGVLPSDWLTAADAGVKSKAGTWTLTGLAAAGGGTNLDYFRITKGGTCYMQGSITLIGDGGEMQVNNRNIALNQIATVDSFVMAVAAANT